MERGSLRSVTSTDNCKKIAEMWEAHEGRGADGAYRTEIAGRTVTIYRISCGEDENGKTWIDVWTGNSKRPSFRISNPPMFVIDPKGPVVTEQTGPDYKKRTVRLREDPVQAIAESVSGERR